jgi:hypothetical protein
VLRACAAALSEREDRGLELVLLREHRGVVAEDHRVTLCGVREEVKDAVLLEQSRHEVQHRLPVLDDVFLRRVLLGREPLDFVGEACIGEDLLDHLDDRLLLEDATVLAVRERRERRAEAQPEVVALAGEVDELRAVHDPVEVANALVRVRDHQAHLRAHGVVRAERRVERVELDADVVRLRDRLVRLEPSGERVGRELVTDEREGAGCVEGHAPMLTPAFCGGYDRCAVDRRSSACACG